MKSTCTPVAFVRARSASSASGNVYALPSAMWLAAFSSSSVSWKTVPSGPMRPSPSTSASSPSRPEPSSRRRDLAQCVPARVGVDLDGAPALEADADPVDLRAVERRAASSPSRARRPARVRGREHLLAREVREVARAVDRRELRPEPARAREQADGEVGARTLRWIASKRCSVSRLRPAMISSSARARRRPGRPRRAGRRAGLPPRAGRARPRARARGTPAAPRLRWGTATRSTPSSGR